MFTNQNQREFKAKTKETSHQIQTIHLKLYTGILKLNQKPETGLLITPKPKETVINKNYVVQGCSRRGSGTCNQRSSSQPQHPPACLPCTKISSLVYLALRSVIIKRITFSWSNRNQSFINSFYFAATIFFGV